MRQLILICLLSLSLSFTSSASAKQLVLVQGYLGNISSWRDSGITQTLERNGWVFGGEYHADASGVGLFRRGGTIPAEVLGSRNTYFLVSLPTEAPIVRQGYILSAYLRDLRQRYPDQALALAGHSAGGIVARYVMVRHPSLNIEQLVTIASPNDGTNIAELGKLAGSSPLAIMAPFMGANTLNRSQGLYSDLLPEKPDRFLFWLNRQPHPAADYASIVRDWDSPQSGDFVVDQHSQYLENVWALRGRAHSYIVPGSHGLSAKDGELLLDLVTTRQAPSIPNPGFSRPLDAL